MSALGIRFAVQAAEVRNIAGASKHLDNDPSMKKSCGCTQHFAARVAKVNG
jgi:hypothetical protein